VALGTVETDEDWGWPQQLRYEDDFVEGKASCWKKV
jgi:hypothetical protein